MSEKIWYLYFTKVCYLHILCYLQDTICRILHWIPLHHGACKNICLKVHWKNNILTRLLCSLPQSKIQKKPNFLSASLVARRKENQPLLDRHVRHLGFGFWLLYSSIQNPLPGEWEKRNGIRNGMETANNRVWSDSIIFSHCRHFHLHSSADSIKYIFLFSLHHAAVIASSSQSKWQMQAWLSVLLWQNCVYACNPIPSEFPLIDQTYLLFVSW